MGERISVAWQQGNAGSVCRDRNEADNALRHYHQALALFAQEQHWMGIADQASNIGYIHAIKGELETALHWFEKARAIYVARGEERKARLTERNIELLRSQGVCS